MANYVYSTLSSDQIYADFDTDSGMLPQMRYSVAINGGANIADKHFHTPLGVVTSVTDAELEYLEKNAVFQQHLAGGFVSISKRQKDADKVSQDMTKRDRSAPMTADAYVYDKDNKTYHLKQA